MKSHYGLESDAIEGVRSPYLFSQEALFYVETPQSQPSVLSDVVKGANQRDSDDGAPCPDCGCPASTASPASPTAVPSKTPPAEAVLPVGPFQPLESSPFADTVRYMRYKAFLRWYYGAHERGWSGAATGVFCLLAGALIIFSFYSVCSLHVLNPATVIVFISLVIVLAFALIVTSGVRFVPRTSVRISTVFIVTAIIVVVVVNSNQGDWNWSTSFGVFTGYSASMESVYDIPAMQDSSQFKALLVQEAEKAGCHLEPTTPSSKTAGFTPRALQAQPPAGASEEKCHAYKWFPVAFFIMQGLVFLAALFYSFVLNRMARYYYLKSRWFISGWNVCSCVPVELLVPALGQSDRKRTTDFVAPEARKGKPTETPKTPQSPATPSRIQSIKVSPGKQTGNGTDSQKPAKDSDEPEEVVDRLRIARGRKIELSVYSPMSAALERIFCWCCRRRTKNDEASMMVPEKVGCWKRKSDSKPGDHSTQSLKHRGRRSSRSRKTVTSTFIGEVDSEGRPDGFGSWRDESYDFGQRLVGYWKHGKGCRCSWCAFALQL